MAETIDNGVAAGAASCLLTAILDVGHLIQTRVDVLGHLVEVAPFLTEFWGLVSHLQEVTVFPLDVVDDAPSVEAAMQTDGDEPRLARHKAGPLSHQ